MSRPCMINKVCSLLHSLIMIHNEVTLAVRHPKGCRNTARSEWTFGKRAAARNGLLVKERPLGMDFWSKERPLGRS